MQYINPCFPSITHRSFSINYFFVNPRGGNANHPLTNKYTSTHILQEQVWKIFRTYWIGTMTDVCMFYNIMVILVKKNSNFYLNNNKILCVNAIVKILKYGTMSVLYVLLENCKICNNDSSKSGIISLL